jgi:hypothetical protein
MKNQKITTAAICLAAVLTTQVQADFISWEGVDSDDWMTATNWQDDDLPDATDTARVWSDTASTPAASNNTVLKAGDTANVDQVWVGNSADPLQSGNLTVESGATLTTVDNFIMNNNSQLTSSGAITVNNGNGMLVRDNSNVTMKSGSTLNKLTLQDNSTATLEAGSSVTDIANLANSSQLTMNNTYSSNLTMNNASSLTVNGTLNGNFGVASTAMQYIGATGTVNGDVVLSAGDQMTVAGDVNGQFSVNQTGSAIIEATANILSDGDNAWIYNTAAVQWNVGADGSVGTLRTNRNETSLDAYDGEWRYNTTAVDMVVVLDDYDSATHGNSIANLQLVSGIQSESTFAGNVTFMLNGDDVTSDFTWDGAGTGSFSGTVVPEPGTYALLAGCVALASVMVRRRR